MIEGLTPTEAAERLGVSPTTLVAWLHELPIPQTRDDGGLARLDEDALAVLEAVRGMRAYDLGFQTIRRHLETLDGGESTKRVLGQHTEVEAVGGEADLPDLAVPDVALTVTPADVADASEAAPVTIVDAAAVAEAVTQALAPVLAALVDLQGAQSRELIGQARLLGQLEADNAFVRRDRDQIAGELIDARRRIAYLETRLEASQASARPWWRFWA